MTNARDERLSLQEYYLWLELVYLKYSIKYSGNTQRGNT